MSEELGGGAQRHIRSINTEFVLNTDVIKLTTPYSDSLIVCDLGDMAAKHLELQSECTDCVPVSSAKM